MQDIQSQADHRRINIKKVGIKNISYPILVRDRARRTQHTVATVNMYVNLPHHFKGAHMSRFVEILNRFHGEINLASVHRMLREMKERLQAQEAHLEIEFPYFVKESAAPGLAQIAQEQGLATESRIPQSAGIGLGEYRCRMHGSLSDHDDSNQGDLNRGNLTLDIRVPIAPPRAPTHHMGLPRSLGHWGTADIRLRFRRFVWIEEIIELASKATRHNLCWPPVDTTGYRGSGGKQQQDLGESSLSVESMAQTLGQSLENHPDILEFSVRVENLAAGFITFATVKGVIPPKGVSLKS